MKKNRNKRRGQSLLDSSLIAVYLACASFQAFNVLGSTINGVYTTKISNELEAVSVESSATKTPLDNGGFYLTYTMTDGSKKEVYYKSVEDTETKYCEKTYDPLGRITNQMDYEGNSATNTSQSTTYVYNDDGSRRTEIAYGNGYSRTYNYDTNGSFINAQQFNPDGSLNWTQTLIPNGSAYTRADGTLMQTLTYGPTTYTFYDSTGTSVTGKLIHTSYNTDGTINTYEKRNASGIITDTYQRQYDQYGNMTGDVRTGP